MNEPSLRKFLLLRLIPLMATGVMTIFTLTSVSFSGFSEKTYRDNIYFTSELFLQNIGTDLILGAYHQVDQKCEAFFRAADISRLRIFDSRKSILCSLERKGGVGSVLEITKSIYFDNAKTNVAATVEMSFNLEKLNSYARKIVWGASFIAFLVAIVSIFLVFRATGKITIPIKNLVASFESGELKTIAELQSATGIKEMSSLFSGVKKLVSQLAESNIRDSKNIKDLTFASVARQVSHDIRSPLSALTMMLEGLQQVPEERRLIIRSSVDRINDIANSLFSQAKEVASNSKNGEKIHERFEKEPALTAELVPALVDLLVSEKRVQFRKFSKVILETDFRDSYGAFAKVDLHELKRVLSNLINNSFEALPKSSGRISVAVRNYPQVVQIIIQDNGKGIPQHILEKLGQPGVTWGKEGTQIQGGLGIGVSHAKKTIESFGGTLQFNSQLEEGTLVSLSFPRSETPEWFVKEIALTDSKAIVVVDDDLSIHQIWQDRMKSLNINLPLLSFSSCAEFKKWCSQFGDSSQLFLVDFEFLGQSQTGLDLIEELNLEARSILVTSRYEDPLIRERLRVSRVKLIPKGMAWLTPIQTICMLTKTPCNPE